MRYIITEQPYILGKFETGATVTIMIYKLSDESTPALTSDSCNEIGSTGVFSWNTSNITTQPVARTEYLWIMTDGTSNQYGKLFLGTDKADISSAGWEELLSSHETDGTFGALLNEMIDAAISSRLAAASYAESPSASAIADAVLDEPVAGHTGWLTKLLSVAKFLGLK